MVLPYPFHYIHYMDYIFMHFIIPFHIIVSLSYWKNLYIMK